MEEVKWLKFDVDRYRGKHNVWTFILVLNEKFRLVYFKAIILKSSTKIFGKK